jgi:Flp pilus assembly protein TadB
MTNNLQSVPKKYRSSMKVIKEESLNKRDAAQQKPQQQAAPATVSAPAEKVAEEPPKPQTRFDQLSARFPWLKPLLIISALLGSCFVVVKLTSFLPSQMLARVICLAFFLGIFVFTYKAYADYMVKSYTDIKEKMLQMFKKSNVREAPVPGEDGATPSNVPSVPDK